MSENRCLIQQSRCSIGPEPALTYVLNKEYSEPLGTHDADYLQDLLNHLQAAHSKDFNSVPAMLTLCRAMSKDEEAMEYQNKLNREDSLGIRLKTAAKYGFEDNELANFEDAEQKDKNQAIVGAIAVSDLQMIEYLEVLGATFDTNDATLGMVAVKAGDAHVMKYLAQRGINFLDPRVVKVAVEHRLLEVFQFLAKLNG